MDAFKEIRWKQRFSNFEKAFQLLSDALDKPISNLSNLEKEGIVQRFEYTFELAWKTLKDYLEYSGVIESLPRDIIKQGFAKGILLDGETWIDMLEKRNLMSHTYDEGIFTKVIDLIHDRYFFAIKQLYEYLTEKNK